MEVNGLAITVTRKAMQSLRMIIKAPDAKVCVSAPYFVSDREILDFVCSRWDWIQKQREKILILATSKPQERRYESGEIHFLFGEEYKLHVLESSGNPAIQLRYDEIQLHVKPGTASAKKAAMMAAWYRARLQNELDTLMNKWMLLLNEPAISWSIRQMKARWGSCCPAKRSMLFNLDLARLPLPYVEYVVVHEFTHLQERYHNQHFKQLMTRHLPDWPTLRKEMNAFAQAHLNA